MSTNDKGGPAFPVHPDMASQLGCIPSASDAGMSLRDYFAAAALQGLLANSGHVAAANIYIKLSYDVADKMLEARK